VAMVLDIACCGLDCGACPAYHAAERLSVEERQAVAEKWNAEFGGTHTVADIDCVGCTHEGRHAPYCASGCEIRTCAVEKSVATCAECTSFACDKLTGFFAMAAEAKVNLEARRSN